MEHRCSERWPLVLPALIHRQDHPVAIGKITNISREGLFLETRSGELTRNLCLEIELGRSTVRRTHQLRLPVVVAYQTEHGIGVLFRSLDPEAERGLRALLYKARNGHAAAILEPLDRRHAG